MTKIILLSTIASTILFAAGYKIPEQSTASTAKAAAHIANISSADASYYNPAAMSSLEDRSQLEVGLTFIHLPKIDYNGTSVLGAQSYSSKKENFLLPYFHYVSPKFGDYRFGLSMTAPAGLSKRWDSAIAKSVAQEFSLRVVELNPTISYAINDKLSIGGGIRIIYSDGVVKSDSSTFSALTGGAIPSVARDMSGDTIEYGYNLALHYQPTDDLKIGLTYRSRVNLDLEGEAKLYYGGALIYNSTSSVSLPIPASLAFGVAYDINDKTNIEFVIDKTYWSTYNSLDFNYSSTQPIFDTPILKNWDNSNAYRIGLTHKYSKTLTLMGGFAIDKSPAPDQTIGYELPDSDALLFSFGFDYKIDENMNFGFAYLYDKKKERTIANNPLTSPFSPNGEFSKGGAHLLNISLGYKF
jgi:long-chain fatty acid transport protein